MHHSLKCRRLCWKEPMNEDQHSDLTRTFPSCLAYIRHVKEDRISVRNYGQIYQ